MTTSDTHPHRAVVEGYLNDLAEGNFEESASQFTEDAVYIHPRIDNDGSTHEDRHDPIVLEGRDSILEYFVDMRGERDVEHALVKTLANECGIAFVGEVSGADTFRPQRDRTAPNYLVGFAEIRDGKISYYIVGNLLGPT